MIWKLDQILEAEEIIQGLIDIMYAIQTVPKDELIPVTILTPFEEVLKRVNSLLKEVEENVVEERSEVI